MEVIKEYLCNSIYCNVWNGIGGIMVSVLTLSAVDRVFEPR